VPNPQAEISHQKSTISHRKRPLTVTLLALWVLTITLLNWVRFGYTLSEWNFIASILPISPYYVAGSGLVWGIIGSGVFGALWKGWRGARRLTLAAASAYFLYYLADHLWIARSTPLTPFALVASSLLLILTDWVVCRRKARAFFGETYEP
jgi:hypothetical protein